MNRLFAYAIIVNVVLLIGFVLVDYVTLNSVATNLGRFLEGFPATNSTERITGIYSYYGIIQVGITARIIIPYTFMTMDVSGISINLPLIWFILTIIVNLYMFWYSGMKKIAEITQSQKAESLPEQKTN